MTRHNIALAVVNGEWGLGLAWLDCENITFCAVLEIFYLLKNTIQPLRVKSIVKVWGAKLELLIYGCPGSPTDYCRQ